MASCEGRLLGKVAIVTGASSGIGLATAKALAADGAQVVMASRSITDAAVDGFVTGGGPPPLCVQCDVVDRAAVAAMVADVIKRFSKVDVLVNAAGVMYFTLMKSGLADQWDRMIDINCKGTVTVIGEVFPHMIAAKSGHVVNISSDAAKTIFGALTVYNASKAFVSTFSKGLRAECVGTGLRVTDIQPGDTATNLLMKNTDTEAAAKMGVSIGEVVGGGEVGPSCLDPKDVADAVLYAVTAPAHVGVHEILIEPRDQMFGDPTAMNV